MKVYLITRMYNSISVDGKETPLTIGNGIVGFAPIAKTKEEAIAFCDGIDGQYIEVDIPDGSLPL